MHGDMTKNIMAHYLLSHEPDGDRDNRREI
jgi:hypothetical protein